MGTGREWNRAIFLAGQIARGDHAFIGLAELAAARGDRDRYAEMADRATEAVRGSWAPDWKIRDLARLGAVAARAGDASRAAALLGESGLTGQRTRDAARASCASRAAARPQAIASSV